jgi:hypothetical protein
MHRLREVSAALLLALVATAAVLPVAAAGAARRGCHCAVRMACCEDGTCTMGRDEPPADGPEWRSCRRDAPAATTLPLDAFERALSGTSTDANARMVGRIGAILPARPHSTSLLPATPPPRLVSF